MSSETPIDPSFHPGYGAPPIDPHQMELTGGETPGGDAYHIVAECTRCSWRGESVAPNRADAQTAVTMEFLAWHHVGGIIDQTALEGMPRPLASPWYRDRRVTGALVAAAVAAENILILAWRYIR